MQVQIEKHEDQGICDVMLNGNGDQVLDVSLSKHIQVWGFGRCHCRHIASTAKSILVRFRFSFSVN